ncbi:RecE family exodeoxyribonuclease [Dickeya fangzhongdai]|uniref:RecE family exodeoxyribonuclease n=1 Tax=Dickeya fangzhongdai TaxID=1778540 RepID=UPI002B25759A|nr:RecE family exodeoxyribonuclease [Dickeya fangzhongdai]WOX99938.1 PD-(D/E)XK nuclease-like domain-containing protein [Dickeya fangzhongdai]WOY04913.1 PD-(D/E)XK nuclease-like domain-containing protein [Dickeya fangzhongdai]
MNNYAFVIKAKAKSDKKSLFCWFSAKSDSRAEREIANILEDAEIETGRGADYQLPVRTNWHVVDDLPEEGVLDDTWCDRYQLCEDGLTWQQIPTPPQSVNIHDDRATVATAQTGAQPTSNELGDITADQASFEQRVLGAFIYREFDILHPSMQRTIASLRHDMDATYAQNLLLAISGIEPLRHCNPVMIFDLVASVKSVWDEDGKTPDVGNLVTFAKEWVNAHNDSSALNGVRRSEITAKWVAKQSMKRTDAGTNAGGNNVTDRSPDYSHTLDTLDYEIAAATLPMDFDIYSIPVGIHRRAKEIVTAKESPFAEWSRFLRNTPGVLDFSRAAIFSLIRRAPADIHVTPNAHSNYIVTNLREFDHANPAADTIAAAMGGTGEVQAPENSSAAESEKITAPNEGAQPKFENLGNGMFSIDGLSDPQPAASAFDADQSAATEPEDNDDVHVQVEVADSKPPETAVTVPDAMGDDITIEEATAGLSSAIKRWTDAIPPKAEPEPDTAAGNSEPAPEYPAHFEPGRYEGLPNNVYHAANGISSTQVKDARVSLMYFNARHVAKTIAREQSKVLDMGNLVHALALQPENLLAEFSIEPEIPQGAFTTTATLRAFIDEYNAGLPPVLSADDIKSLLEEHNATLPAPIPLGASVEETGQSYMVLPAEYQRIEYGQKQTAAAMKACIKEFNATLPAPMKTSGSRDALLEQLAVINPDLVAQEAQKPAPLKLSGAKADLIQSVKSVNPNAVFADELLDAWRENPDEKILVTRAQLATATAIQAALFAHPTAGKLLQHPSRSVEVSYFGMDPETGLEVRVRPDLEIELNGPRIAADLKTISMWNVKRDALRAKLHREIIERDYHLSAAMYCDVASLDQFYWIFVNKDEGYHWIAVIEASPELLELGRLEYQRTMRDIANAYDTGIWPAPIIDDYTDELNDFDLRRLEALRQA